MSHFKLLLTSSGNIKGKIKLSLEGLLEKPIEDSSILYVPTAMYPYPQAISNLWQILKGQVELGWKKFGILELTSLPSISKDIWLPQIQETDVLFIGGGNKFYLSYWMDKSGIFDLLPEILERGTIYIGASAGSQMLTPAINFDQKYLATTGIFFDNQYDEKMKSETGKAKTLNLVDFVIRPHFNSEYFSKVNLSNIEKWFIKAKNRLYALDDQSAVIVIDGKEMVVSNSNKWKLFEE